ncbi:GNAT family N-acetyltransferase [Yersinia nurmii]|uniref:GNAT family N-acetyltransferase n=1 Tax=Yersinia nurmii TaxID=685706 RepID=A0AAW7JZP4_9GAMM|nr:GNAT family N-acetyltransferase [Yersinia nurmii]MDN0086642.1 GNAT family N-acetyltransferase [Yersinia nurmii]
MTEYRIEFAKKQHLPFLASIEQQAAKLFPAHLLPDDLKTETLPLIEFVVAQREKRLWVAKDSRGIPVGFALVYWLEQKALLGEIDVLPQHGGQGIGSQLLAAVIDHLRNRGATALYLTTFSRFAPSVALYAKFGFIRLSSRNTPPWLAKILTDEVASGMTERVAMVRHLP